MSKGLKQTGSINKLIQTGKSAFTFFMNKTKRVDQYMTFISNPDVKLSKSMFEIFDQKHVVTAYQLNLSKVMINQLIYIPKLMPELDINKMKELYAPEAIAKLEEIKGYPNQFYCYDRDFSNRKASEFLYNIDHNPDTHVQVRVLSNVKLPFSFSKFQYRRLDLELLDDQYEYLLDMASDYNIQVDEKLNEVMKTVKKKFKEEKPVKPITKVVIHIHGGGFITMSSGSHQVYTRTWANKLDCPIFSIDYRLSPEYKYPAAIDDVWQAYTWIVRYGFIQLGILPEKIVLVGDSAGGNLVAAISMLAVQ